MLSKTISKAEVQNLFKIRNHMIDVKENFKSNPENMYCRLCLIFSETQDHLISCPKIREKLSGVIKFETLNINMACQSIKNKELLAKNYTFLHS